MADPDKSSPSDSKKGSEAPKRSVVADIVDSGVFSHLRRSFGSMVGSKQQKVVHPSDRTADADSAESSKERHRKRTLMLAEKYEKLFAARKDGEPPAPVAASALTPTAKSKPSTSLKPPSAESTTSKPASAPRIRTIRDLNDEGNAKASAADDIHRGGIIKGKKSASATGVKTRRLRCLIRRDVKEPIFPGKLVLGISTTCAMILVFVFQLFWNKTTFNGRCMARVDYSVNADNKPIYSPLGYVACEHNLNTSASYRVPFGAMAADEGFPNDIVFSGSLAASDASYDGPNVRMMDHYGGVVGNKIRLYNESSRLWTAIFLHAGFQHLIINMLLNMQLLYILEPDWGVCRTFLVYLLSGYVGNLAHGSMCPCVSAVGASGALFGLCGALVPYCVEHWDTLVAPIYILLESVVFLCIELFLPNRQTSGWAHLAGYVSGFVFGFATLKSVALFDRGTIFQRLALKFFSGQMREETQQKYRTKVLKATHAEELARIHYEHKAKTAAKKWRFMKRLFGIYPYGPYRLRMRDNITRLVFLCIGVAFAAYFYTAMHVESIYSKMSANAASHSGGGCVCGYILDTFSDPVMNAVVGNLGGKFYCFLSKEIYNLYCNPAVPDNIVNAATTT